jgi:hypothetical protein
LDNATLKMRSVMCVSYCLHDWQTIHHIVFYWMLKLFRQRDIYFFILL